MLLTVSRRVCHLPASQVAGAAGFFLVLCFFLSFSFAISSYPTSNKRKGKSLALLEPSPEGTNVLVPISFHSLL